MNPFLSLILVAILYTAFEADGLPPSTRAGEDQGTEVAFLTSITLFKLVFLIFWWSRDIYKNPSCS